MAQHKTLKISSLLIASAFSTLSYGAGFAIMEQSVTGLGHAFAGSAAVAEDASTIFFNPAGLTYLTHSQVAQGLNFILPKSEFNNEGSTINPTLPDPLALTGGEGDAGSLAIVPNLYYAHRLNNDVVLGIGVNAPFGLVTEYDDDWIGRYHAIRSDMMTVNINPSIGIKATERLSVGFGINLQYIDLELTQAVDFGAACVAAGAACAQPQQHDGKAKLTADDWSWGFNLGLIFQATDATRFALAYRSKVSHHLTGEGKFRIPSNPSVQAVAAGGNFVDAAISGDVTLPESASFAIHHQINDKWAVLADVSWTRWERFQELAIFSPNPTNKLNGIKEENWSNNMRYGIGLSYDHNDRWTFRGGIAYDESPILDEYRTPRIPGEDRKWLAIGTSYQYSDHITIDAAYTHIFVSDPSINDHTDQGYILSGDYDTSVDILGVQMRWLFL
ncbi:MAG: long-chain fatty acid transporter [Methylophaga sp.]|nr:MAG: long-chain fatty acid transporter [Methylophaga sp.]